MTMASLSHPKAQDQTLTLPANVEAEQALLGALLIDNRLVEDVQLLLRPAHFSEDVHGRIYEAILHTVDRNLVANPITLKPKFQADAALAPLGGVGYLATLSANSAALTVARGEGVPAVARDVFLDHEKSADAVHEALAEVESLARRHGHAVAIGHPRDATLDTLAEWLPGLEQRGFLLVPLSALVRERHPSG